MNFVQNGAATGISNSGHVGVDIWMNNGHGDYLPCANPGDSAFGACFSAASHAAGYYKDLHYYSPNSSQFPYGVFVDQSDNGVLSGFGDKITGLALEIYPNTDPETEGSGHFDSGYDLQPCCGRTVYGGLRVTASGFGSNGYSAAIGTVSVPQAGDRNVDLINGYICNSGAWRPPSCPNGKPVPDGSVNISWFGQQPVTNRSSTGYPVASFASWPNYSCNTSSTGVHACAHQDGYYTSGPILPGKLTVFVTYTNRRTGAVTNWTCTPTATSWGERLDFNIDDRYLGQSGICSGGHASKPRRPLS